MNIIKYHHKFCWLLFWTTVTGAEEQQWKILLGQALPQALRLLWCQGPTLPERGIAQLVATVVPAQNKLWQGMEGCRHRGRWWIWGLRELCPHRHSQATATIAWWPPSAWYEIVSFTPPPAKDFWLSQPHVYKTVLKTFKSLFRSLSLHVFSNLCCVRSRKLSYSLNCIHPGIPFQIIFFQFWNITQYPITCVESENFTGIDWRIS